MSMSMYCIYKSIGHDCMSVRAHACVVVYARACVCVCVCVKGHFPGSPPPCCPVFVTTANGPVGIAIVRAGAYVWCEAHVSVSLAACMLVYAS